MIVAYHGTSLPCGLCPVPTAAWYGIPMLSEDVTEQSRDIDTPPVDIVDPALSFRYELLIRNVLKAQVWCRDTLTTKLATKLARARTQHPHIACLAFDLQAVQ